MKPFYFDTRTMEMLRVAVARSIDSRGFCLDPEFRTFVANEITGEMVIELCAKIAGDKTEPQSVRWPLDWVQALKARWLPDWARKRWPIRYATLVFSFDVLYPDYKPAPNMGRFFPVSNWQVTFDKNP